MLGLHTAQGAAHGTAGQWPHYDRHPQPDGHRDWGQCPGAAGAERLAEADAGQPITLRLQSGEQLSGVLDGDDSYTLALRIPGHADTALVFKHAIAVLVPGGA
jgi:sRNA-binding regulator protein Hfq